MGEFYLLIDAKSAKLEACIEKDDIQGYTVEVHALKNTARMIGALELSNMFYQMECFGKEGSAAEIKQRTPEILTFYRGYKVILVEFAKQNKGVRRKVDDQTLYVIFKRLHDAMDTFELEKADEAMAELNTYDVSPDMKKAIETLSVYMADVDMAEVLQLTAELCKELEKIALVMLVDDDEINRHVVTELLNDTYRVISAESGKQALSLLAEYRPDLILLDVYMPEMDGHEVLRQLKATEAYAEIPVIFLTSDEDEATEIQGLSEGAIDFIRKPLRKAVAISRINRILELSYLQKNLKSEVKRQTEVAENRRQKVERISLQMVQALVNTIDAKDSYTNGHSTRVAKYAVMLAERMGYSGEKLERLQFAALLHDIGKIGVPKEIINKPTRLSDEEYEVIKTHPAIGANILEEITEIPDIAVGARWHHERFDGKGYPDGLKGEEIPELARIIGVADAYDAMTSKRSYRDVLSQEIVLAEVEKGKGSQFDPDIADLMILLIKEDKQYQMHE